MLIYTVVDNDQSEGVNVFNFKSEKDAKLKLNQIINEYRSVYSVDEEESIIDDYGANIVSEGDHIGTVEIIENHLL